MIDQLPNPPMPGWLQFASPPLGPVPLTELLEDSVYYPACGFDGRPVQYLAGNYYSFVYADYWTERDEAIRQLSTFKGYSPIAFREIATHELAPRGWCRFVPAVGRQIDQFPTRLNQPTFAIWTVLERKPEFVSGHGPERFSLLYVGGEAVSTSRSLYNRNGCKPDVVVIIAPGEADFRDERSELAREVLCHNRAGLPRLLVSEVWEEPRDRGPVWPSYPHRVGVLGRWLRLWERARNEPKRPSAPTRGCRVQSEPTRPQVRRG